METKTTSFKLDSKTVFVLKRLALQLSEKQGERVTASQIIIEAVKLYAKAKHGKL